MAWDNDYYKRRPIGMSSYYLDGYRAGMADRYMGAEKSDIAVTSPLPGYSIGYIDGYSGREAGHVRKDEDSKSKL